MRNYPLILLGIMAISSGGCCQLSPIATDTPDRPTVKSTWRESEKAVGVTSIGPLILNKGESTDNGSLGVKLVDIVPRNCPSFLSHNPEPSKAVLQFYRPTDHEILCEVALSGTANTFIDRENMCGKKTGISLVAINAINAKDGWVSFYLAK